MIAVDDRDLPIVRVRWPAQTVSAAEIEAFAEAMERAYASGRVAVIVDATRAAPIGARALARVVAIERRMRADVLAARAIVVPNATALTVLSAVIAAIPHRVPTRAFEDLASAERWAREHV